MSTDKNNFYLTTPIYYVNARPHIGHAYTTIVADVLARRHRLLGDDTFFLTGTDEHGQKIERSAAAAGIAPQQFADEVSSQFRKLWDRMGISYDDYIRTTDPKHARGVQKLFRELYTRGFIYLDSYTGAYCVSDEAFVDVTAGEPCPDCGRITEIVTEENFFFKLSAFQEKLLALIESNGLKIENEARRNEVLSFVRGGLKDLSVSRSSFTWGIPVPDDVQQAAGAKQKHIVYVWLDALANYMTAIGYGSETPEDVAQLEKFWPADLHLVGKEIIRFHCVYWPAFLMAAELPLPKAITAHGWLLFDNAKMSKSKGNIVRTETILEAFGEHVYGKQFPDSTREERDLFASDVLRYFLLREIPFGQDGSFSFDALVTRYNADLANGYGNLVSRTLAMIRKYFDGTIPFGTMEERVASGISTNLSAMTKNYNELDFSNLLNNLSNIVRAADGHITEKAPWKLAAEPAHQRELTDVLYTAIESIRIITAAIEPVLPFTASRVFAQLGIPSERLTGTEANWVSKELGTLAPIFPRADKSLVDIMIAMENETAKPSTEARPETPLKSASTPTPASPVPTDRTDPGAPPRAFTEPGSAAHVAGSASVSTHNGPPPSHAEATPSAPFNSAAAQAPITADPADASTQIAIDDFAKVELRVAQVLLAERIPKADKLLRLEVDLGFEKRQILSGIAQWYQPEDLVGRRIIVVTNLAPRKMRGLESHGMLLAGSEGENGKPVLATMSEEIALGTRLK